MLYLRIMTIKAKGKIVLTIKKITIMKTILYTIQNFAKRVVMVLTAILMVSSLWGAETTVYSGSFPSATGGSTTYTANVSLTLENKSWTASYCYRSSTEFRLGRNNSATVPTKFISTSTQGASLEMNFGYTYVSSFSVVLGGTYGTVSKVEIYESSDNGTTYTSVKETTTYNSTFTYTPTTPSSSETRYAVVVSGTSNPRVVVSTVTIKRNEAPSGYAITWAANGHGDVSGLASSGTSITLPNISVTGYTNTGWKANVAVTNTSTSASISANTFIATGTGVTLSGATTFTAQWETATYTVSYNKGTYGTGTNTSATKTHGVALTLLGTTFTRDGYTQQGWASDEAGTTKVYDLEASYTANAAITLYPYWEKRPLTNYRTSCCTSYVITLADAGEVDGGTFNSNVARSCAEKTVTLSSSLCGYSQGEWTVTKTGDASTVVAVNNNTFVMPAYAVTVSLTTSESTDHFIDKMHRTTNYTGTGRALSGCGYTVPKLNNKSQDLDGGCEGEHFKFLGWAAEVDVNMSDGTLIGTPTLLEGNSTNNATGTTYYAIWQKETTAE